MKNEVPMVRLGEWIEIQETRNTYGADYPFTGVNKNKAFMPTVADTNELDNRKYKVVKKNMFVFSGMQTGRDICIRLALYSDNSPALISPAYTTFIIRDGVQVLPEYFFLHFCRFEMDRYGAFLSDGSIRSNLDWDRFCEIEIPLPSIETQRALVAIYGGLQKIIADNEALIKEMESVCHAFVVDCKTKYPKVRLGEHVREINEKNDDLRVTLAQGVDINMRFIPAKREAIDKANTRIVHNGQFAFNKVIKCDGTKLPIALRNGPDCIISESYQVFEVKNKTRLLSQFLMLWLTQVETQRYCGYKAWGSTRDVFSFLELSNLQIPLPPIELQRSIAEIYNCLQKSKRIVEETRELMKNLCPALVQKAAHSA